eukprot:6212081-Amphidinium_carterae.1
MLSRHPPRSYQKQRERESCQQVQSGMDFLAAASVEDPFFVDFESCCQSLAGGAPSAAYSMRMRSLCVNSQRVHLTQTHAASPREVS